MFAYRWLDRDTGACRKGQGLSSVVPVAADGVAGMTQVAKFNNQPERFQCATEGGPTFCPETKSSKPDENPTNH